MLDTVLVDPNLRLDVSACEGLTNVQSEKSEIVVSTEKKIDSVSSDGVGIEMNMDDASQVLEYKAPCVSTKYIDMNAKTDESVTEDAVSVFMYLSMLGSDPSKLL